MVLDAGAEFISRFHFTLSYNLSDCLFVLFSEMFYAVTKALIIQCLLSHVWLNE